jgi:hypothetical protein
MARKRKDPSSCRIGNIPIPSVMANLALVVQINPLHTFLENLQEVQSPHQQVKNRSRKHVFAQGAKVVLIYLAFLVSLEVCILFLLRGVT